MRTTGSSPRPDFCWGSPELACRIVCCFSLRQRRRLRVGSVSVGRRGPSRRPSATPQLLYAKRESEDLAADPKGELDELTRHWEARGLRPDTAREVARQLSEHDALAAQLEWEYSFVEPVPATFPIWFGVGAGLAYMVGALVPLLITYFAPVDVEPWAILAAVTITLVLSSVVSSRTGQLMPRRMLARTLVVGVLTMAVSYAAGELLL